MTNVRGCRICRYSQQLWGRILMSFIKGQMVLCVDASPAPNPWHRVNPLRWGGIYRVERVAPPECCYPGQHLIAVDNSGRLWQAERFRSLCDLTWAGRIIKRVTKKTKASTNCDSRCVLKDPSAGVMSHKGKRV